MKLKAQPTFQCKRDRQPPKSKFKKDRERETGTHIHRRGKKKKNVRKLFMQ